MSFFAVVSVKAKFEFLKSMCQEYLGLLNTACYLERCVQRCNRKPPDEISMTSSSLFETDPACKEGRSTDKWIIIFHKDGGVDTILGVSPELCAQSFCGYGNDLVLG